MIEQRIKNIVEGIVSLVRDEYYRISSDYDEYIALNFLFHVAHELPSSIMGVIIYSMAVESNPDADAKAIFEQVRAHIAASVDDAFVHLVNSMGLSNRAQSLLAKADQVYCETVARESVDSAESESGAAAESGEAGGSSDGTDSQTAEEKGSE